MLLIGKKAPTFSEMSIPPADFYFSRMAAWFSLKYFGEMPISRWMQTFIRGREANGVKRQCPALALGVLFILTTVFPRFAAGADGHTRPYLVAVGPSSLRFAALPAIQQSAAIPAGPIVSAESRQPDNEGKTELPAEAESFSWETFTNADLAMLFSDPFVLPAPVLDAPVSSFSPEAVAKTEPIHVEEGTLPAAHSMSMDFVRRYLAPGPGTESSVSPLVTFTRPVPRQIFTATGNEGPRNSAK